mgnify:CR=1 FL=1
MNISLKIGKRTTEKATVLSLNDRYRYCISISVIYVSWIEQAHYINEYSMRYQCCGGEVTAVIHLSGFHEGHGEVDT